MDSSVNAGVGRQESYSGACRADSFNGVVRAEQEILFCVGQRDDNDNTQASGRTRGSEDTDGTIRAVGTVADDSRRVMVYLQAHTENLQEGDYSG